MIVRWKNNPVVEDDDVTGNSVQVGVFTVTGLNLLLVVDVDIVVAQTDFTRK